MVNCLSWWLNPTASLGAGAVEAEAIPAGFWGFACLNSTRNDGWGKARKWEIRQIDEHWTFIGSIGRISHFGIFIKLIEMDNLINKKECVRVVVALHCCTWGIQPTNMGVQKQPFYGDILMGMIYIYTIYNIHILWENPSKNVWCSVLGDSYSNHQQPHL